MPVQTDLTVVIEDRPGIAARVAEALGRAGINIHGVSGITSGRMGILHVLVADDDAGEARRSLEAAGVEIHSERDAWIAECPDSPGELGRLMRRLADAEVNCDLVYLTTGGRVVIGAPQFERLVKLLS